LPGWAEEDGGMDERKDGEDVKAGGERADEGELITLCWATFGNRRFGRI